MIHILISIADVQFRSQHDHIQKYVQFTIIFSIHFTIKLVLFFLCQIFFFSVYINRHNSDQNKKRYQT